METAEVTKTFVAVTAVFTTIATSFLTSFLNGLLKNYFEQRKITFDRRVDAFRRVLDVVSAYGFQTNMERITSSNKEQTIWKSDPNLALSLPKLLSQTRHDLEKEFVKAVAAYARYLNSQSEPYASDYVVPPPTVHPAQLYNNVFESVPKEFRSHVCAGFAPKTVPKDWKPPEVSTATSSEGKQTQETPSQLLYSKQEAQGERTA